MCLMIIHAINTLKVFPCFACSTNHTLVIDSRDLRISWDLRYDQSQKEQNYSN